MAKNPPAQNQSETSNKLGRPNVLSVLISSLLDFFILGACVGGTIGQAQEIQSTQTDNRQTNRRTDRQADSQTDRQTDTSKIRPPQFAIGSHQFLIRILHFARLRGGDHRTGQEPIKN